MNKKEWKEAREGGYSRRKIIYYLSTFYIKSLQWYFYQLWFKLTKYEHKHEWDSDIRCLICRKDKRDIDYERLHPNRFKKWKPPKMKHGKFTKWNWLPYYPDKIKIGRYVDIGALTLLQGKHGIIIKENVQIGAHCAIYSEDTERNLIGTIIIEKGIKIGAHSVILPKWGQHVHTIDKNIKAGSVVF
jgi:hypothetical protein